MKLLIAIVNNDDSAVVSSALTKEGYTVTKLSTTADSSWSATRHS